VLLGVSRYFLWDGALNLSSAPVVDGTSHLAPCRTGEAVHRAFVKRIARLMIACILPLGLEALGIAQKTSQDPGILPKYDMKTEAKFKGTVDEVNIVPLGAKKELRELIIKAGEEKIYIYVCPKTFEDEIGVSFSKGDEIAVTGSKVKQEETDVILARELTKGTDTLVFRDGKGNPVWDARTGK
jgi:hypothetical protein